MSARIVTQKMLAEFAALKQSERRCKELRKVIIGLLEDGANVESGQYRAWIKSFQSRPLTHANLRQLLGEDAVLALQERVPRKQVVHLRVETSFESLVNIVADSSHREVRPCPPRHR